MSVSQAGTLGRELLAEAMDSPPLVPLWGTALPWHHTPGPTRRQQQLFQGREPHGTVGATGEAEAGKGAEGGRGG